MRLILSAISVLVFTSLYVRADNFPTTAPCENSTSLSFDDSPAYRIGDPSEAAKQQAGMNPLHVKQIDIEATETQISVRVRTHDSFNRYWDYAAKRRELGAPLPSTDPEGKLRGSLTRFLMAAKDKEDRAVEVR